MDNFSVSDLISIFAIFLSIPAAILSVYNFLINRNNPKFFIAINKKNPLYKINSVSTLSCFLRFINFAEHEFTVTRISLKVDKQTFYFFVDNKALGKPTTLGTYTSQDFLTIKCRQSGEMLLKIQLNSDLLNSKYRISVYTTLRKRPFKAKIEEQLPQSLDRYLQKIK